MTNSNSRFTRSNRLTGRKGATYTCDCCKKLTRETGDEESSVQMCAACYATGDIHNALSDRGFSDARCAEINARLRELKADTAEADTAAIRNLRDEVLREI